MKIRLKRLMILLLGDQFISDIEGRKPSRLYSMVHLRCPVCSKAGMFVSSGLYTWKNIGAVKDRCDICGGNLKPETGFYFGAAYVNWALTVALWISVLVVLHVFDAVGWIEYSFLTHPVTFLLTGFALTILIFPYLLRLSRSIWAHIHIHAHK